VKYVAKSLKQTAAGGRSSDTLLDHGVTAKRLSRSERRQLRRQAVYTGGAKLMQTSAHRRKSAFYKTFALRNEIFFKLMLIIWWAEQANVLRDFA